MLCRIVYYVMWMLIITMNFMIYVCYYLWPMDEVPPVFRKKNGSV